MKLIAIAVVAANGVIGDGDDQPFKFPEDWAHFKRTTTGHPMIMGRKTYEAMGLLSNRTSIVLTRNPSSVRFPDERPRGATGMVATTIDEALEMAAAIDDEVYLIGGGQVYRLGWAHVDELNITEVHEDAEGTVTFPRIDPDEWREVSRDPRGEFDFVRYVRER